MSLNQLVINVILKPDKDKGVVIISKNGVQK